MDIMRDLHDRGHEWVRAAYYSCLTKVSARCTGVPQGLLGSPNPQVSLAHLPYATFSPGRRPPASFLQ